MPKLREERFLRVKVDMVTRCQLRCVMCHFAHPEFKESPVTMERELLEKVAGEIFPRAHDVVLSSSAEPLLAKELPRALELCREHGVPNFHFSTNCLAMTDAIMDTIIDVQMPVLTVSCDAGTKETFEKIRKPGKWEPFLRRFDIIAARKKARGSELPAVSVTCVLMRSNIREVPQMIRFFKDRGVRDMNFVHMAVIGGLGVEDEDIAVLLPVDPDASARRLHEALSTDGRHTPVVITDTFGRPWRDGLVDVALGSAGLAPLKDDRGSRDRIGRELLVTQPATADQLAAAAGLLMLKSAGIPVVVVEGFPIEGDGAVADLLRDPATDLFR